MCRQERSIAEDIQYILGGWNQQGLALTDLDTIDVGLAPQTDNDDE